MLFFHKSQEINVVFSQKPWNKCCFLAQKQHLFSWFSKTRKFYSGESLLEMMIQSSQFTIGIPYMILIQDFPDFENNIENMVF